MITFPAQSYLFPKFDFYIIIIIMIIIISFIWEFFAPALAVGFPLESDWQQIPSSLQDSS